MADYRFNREARTPYSEVYAIDDERVQDLIEAIDDQIVTSADPYREDLIVTVWRGEEMGVFADDDSSEDGEDGDGGSDEGDEEPA